MTAANPSCDTHAFPGPAARKLGAEPTLEEILAARIVRALMLAEQVDEEALTAMSRSVASRLRKRACAPPQARRPSAAAAERACNAGRREPIRPNFAEG
jgi:hypothetical protein